jgi:dUTP pyrophosphatase
MSDPEYTLHYKTLEGAADLYTIFGTLPYSDANAGVDLYCREDVEVQPGKVAFLKLGIAAKLVRNDGGSGSRSCHYWLLPRSSISKKGLMMANSVGVIDRTYRGELMGAVVVAGGAEPVKVSRGERLFQIVAPDMGHIAAAVPVEELDATVRGAGGFGSTGIN